MATGRDRASGWRHAKLSGHENESDVETLFKDQSFRDSFSKRLKIGTIVSASVGGLCETNVPSVLGKKTKSKTDLQLLLADGTRINVSIKKSPGGQVYLIGVENFINGFEKQFNTTIPEDIKDSLRLYFFGHPNTNALLNDANVVKGEDSLLIQYQREHNRLVWKSLYNYNKPKADALMTWFKDNMGNIATFCFSSGLASNKDDWADYVWYVNELGEGDFDHIFSIKDIVAAVVKNQAMVLPSSKNGGSTTYLPLGFVQWHQEKMQFHHSMEKLLQIVPTKY